MTWLVLALWLHASPGDGGDLRDPPDAVRELVERELAQRFPHGLPSGESLVPGFVSFVNPSAPRFVRVDLELRGPTPERPDVPRSTRVMGFHDFALVVDRQHLRVASPSTPQLASDVHRLLRTRARALAQVRAGAAAPFDARLFAPSGRNDEWSFSFFEGDGGVTEAHAEAGPATWLDGCEDTLVLTQRALALDDPRFIDAALTRRDHEHVDAAMHPVSSVRLLVSAPDGARYEAFVTEPLDGIPPGPSAKGWQRLPARGGGDTTFGFRRSTPTAMVWLWLRQTSPEDAAAQRFVQALQRALEACLATR